jgi:hypothetical protein
MPPAPPIAPPPAPDRTQLRARLDTLAASGTRCLRQGRFRRAWREAAGWAPLALPVLPFAVLVMRTSGLVALPPLGAPALAGLALLGVLLWLVGRVAWLTLTYQPPRAVALALHDRHLATHERLVIADEFLTSADLAGNAPHSAFMRAAVDDAGACAERAFATPLPPLPVSAWRIQRASWWGVPIAAALILLTGVGLGPRTLPEVTLTKPPLLVADASPVAPPPENPAATTRRAPRPPASPVAPEPPAPEDKTASAPRALPRLARKEQPMDGQPGSGGGSHASNSNSGTQAAGISPSQRSAPKEKKPEVARAEEPEEKERPTKEKKAPKRRKQDAGQLAVDANPGQGKSSSSSGNLNPFESPEEADKTGKGALADAEDEAAEDEDEQEKSNTVNKPMGNTKDPVVDRNLSTRPPEDGDQPGDGRGGPSDIKKTRGVPSMILGIPVPDRVPGTPSPGRSKVTQEYTRPKEESHAALEAQVHAARTGAVGHVEQPDLLPWRRALLEKYFMSVRQRPDEAGTEPTTNRTP